MSNLSICGRDFMLTDCIGSSVEKLLNQVVQFIRLEFFQYRLKFAGHTWLREKRERPPPAEGGREVNREFMPLQRMHRLAAIRWAGFRDRAP